MTRAHYRPETDGFAFTNDWTFDTTETATLTQLVTDAVDVIEIVLAPLILVAEGAVLHFEGGPGATWLRDQTKNELVKLKARIKSGTPVTVGLVGTTWNPLFNHQVLVYGFNDNPDETTTLFVYDNNAPGVETTYRMDFSGPELQAVESPPFGDRAPLDGLICT